MENVRAIFFDADDTLFSIRGTVGDQYAEILSQFGIDYPASEMNRAVRAAWMAHSPAYHNEEGRYQTCHDRDRKLWRLFVEHVLRGLGHEAEPPLVEQAFSAIHSHFGTAASREITPGLMKLLPDLKESGYSLGTFTNNDRRIHSLVDQLDLKPHFEHVFCSADLGARKPSLAPFHKIREKLQLKPEELLYIGDSYTNDYLPARAAGWNAVWFNWKKQEVDKELEDDRRITDLEELHRLLL